MGRSRTGCYHPGFPQCGQGARTTRRHSTPLWAEISCWQWRQFVQCSLSSSRSSAASSRQSTQPATVAGSSVKTADETEADAGAYPGEIAHTVVARVCTDLTTGHLEAEELDDEDRWPPW